eukprot:scaffold247686_cov76-Attheya_sp.AAC.1
MCTPPGAPALSGLAANEENKLGDHWELLGIRLEATRVVAQCQSFPEADPTTQSKSPGCPKITGYHEHTWHQQVMRCPLETAQ